jgi:hypothetical protein
MAMFSDTELGFFGFIIDKIGTYFHVIKLAIMKVPDTQESSFISIDDKRIVDATALDNNNYMLLLFFGKDLMYITMKNVSL